MQKNHYMSGQVQQLHQNILSYGITIMPIHTLHLLLLSTTFLHEIYMQRQQGA